MAKRLEEEAAAGEIYVSRAVRDAVSDAFDFETIGLLRLTGRRQRLEAFRAGGAHPAMLRRAQETGAEAAGVAPRDAELRRLVGYCDKAKAGTQQNVCIVGAPGIGKSRLIADWCQSDIGGDFRVVWTGCHACSEHFPLLPVADLVGRLAGLRLEGWPPRVAGDVDRATTALPVDAKTRAELVALLRSLDEPPEEAMEGWPRDLRAGLIALLTAVTKEEPLCLVVEDVQWIDEASRSLLTDILAQQLAWPVFVILSARDPFPEWLADSPGVPTLRMEPLPRAVIERLIAVWAGPALLPASTVRAIANRAEGHPYFARELVESLRHRRVASLTAEASLPSTLEELFLAQLDQLAVPLRRLVQTASVVGEYLSHHLLYAAMGDDAPLTDALLREATVRGLLRAGSAPGQFIFGRRLLFEVAYSTIPPSRRKDLHARIATHLVGELKVTGDPAVHAAAHHAYLGYRDERAVDLLVRSARLYRAQYANRQAIQAASRALELIAALRDPAQFRDQRLETLLFLAQSYQVVGELDQAEGALAEAEILAEECPDQELVARIATCAATLCWMQGNSSEAEQRFLRACQLRERLRNDTRVAQALVGMGLCANQRGKWERALDLFSQAANRRGSTGARPPPSPCRLSARRDGDGSNVREGGGSRCTRATGLLGRVQCYQL